MATDNGDEPVAEETSKPVTLTEEMARELRRPFTVGAILFKPQSVRKDKTAALGTFYIDARLAAARLDAVIGSAGWSDEYRVLFEADPTSHADNHFPIECGLTVLGVTKRDVGVYQKATSDELATKSGYSDSFKRAAVKFGIGAYLYAIPGIWAPVKVVEGKVRGFSDQGIQQLKRDYTKAVTALVDRFGKPLDHGDVVTPDEDLVAIGEYQPPRVATIPASKQRQIHARAKEVGLVMIDNENAVDKDRLASMVEMVTGQRHVSGIPTTELRRVLLSLDRFKDDPAAVSAKIKEFDDTKVDREAEAAL